MSFRVLCDQARMPLLAHSLTHQNQPWVYPSHTPVSFFLLSTVVRDILFAWSFLFLGEKVSFLTGCFFLWSLGRLWLTHGCQPGASLQLPAHLQLPGRGQVCADELVAPVRRAGWCLFPTGHLAVLTANLYISRNDIPSSIKWLDKTFSAPILRVTKEFWMMSRQEHFVRRIISFENIQKIMLFW